MPIDEATLEMTEAIIAAHKAAKRHGDVAALALIEPLLQHAGQRLAEHYCALFRSAELQDRHAAKAAGRRTVGGTSSLN